MKTGLLLASKFRLFVCIVSIFLLFSTSYAGNLKQSMLDNLDYIANVYKTAYAPFEWKKQLFNWDLDQQIALAKSKVESADQLTVKEYQKIMSDFFHSTRDYHVSINYYATEQARLYFNVKESNDKYYIVRIERDRLPKDQFPFSLGDEIVSFDGKPTAMVIDEVKKELSASDYPTDTALAELFLTLRAAQMSMHVPQGPITLRIKPKGKNSILTCTLQWDYSPEEINNSVVEGYGRQNYVTQSIPMMGTGSLLNRRMVTPLWNVFSNYQLEQNPYFLGTRKSYIPSLGTKIWQSADTNLFNAYIYITEKRKKIGYVRIPDYSGSAQHTQEFAQIIKLFEKKTDALVIDEINNPGGSLLYIYALVRHLTDKVIIPPKHREAISQATVFEAIQILRLLKSVTNDAEAVKAIQALNIDVAGYPITYQTIVKVREYLNFLIDQWNSGKTLTDDGFIFGIEAITPDSSIHYTKPILMIVNSLDFSGGDFFPAILQDNKRVTIFGTRTAGAGGYVNLLSYPNYFSMQHFSFTGSIATRLNGEPIENLGVTPDVSYSLTRQDFCFKYKYYVSAINAAVMKLLQ